VGALWATKSKGVGLIVPAVRFQDFQPMWSWITNVTDGQTDRWTDDMRSQYRALHYSALRGKNEESYMPHEILSLPLTFLYKFT